MSTIPKRKKPTEPKFPAADEAVLRQSVVSLNLNPKTVDTLQDLGVWTLRQLARQTADRLFSTRKMQRGEVGKIRRELRKHKLSLGMPLPLTKREEKRWRNTPLEELLPGWNLSPPKLRLSKITQERIPPDVTLAILRALGGSFRAIPETLLKRAA